MSDREIELLTDAHVQRFILEGFLVLGLDELGEGFHENVYRAALERQPQSGLSDDLDAAMPELREVLDSATVRGALEGLLGRGYLRHPHSAAYVESGATEAAGTVPFDQGWHRDSYWGVQRVRHHRPRWLLCMYYPAAVTLEMGPTAIAPGSQYYALPADGDGSAHPPAQPIRYDQIDDPESLMQGADLAARDRLLRDTIVSLDPSLREAPMVVPAGSFCCFHYDMYHRRMRRLPARDSQVPQVPLHLGGGSHSLLRDPHGTRRYRPGSCSSSSSPRGRLAQHRPGRTATSARRCFGTRPAPRRRHWPRRSGRS